MVRVAYKAVITVLMAIILALSIPTACKARDKANIIGDWFVVITMVLSVVGMWI